MTDSQFDDSRFDEASLADVNRLKSKALNLLRTVVQEFLETGRRPFAAGIKPAMRQQDPQFSEQVLGFETFRAFLEDAAQQGIVTISTVGPHLLLSLPGQPPTGATLVARRRTSPPIPPDLWMAFVNWTPGRRRVYDKTLGRAFTFRVDADPDETSDESSVRKLVADEPERFVDINPISFETQLGWMKQYAESLPESFDKRLIKTALKHDERPVNAFHMLLQRSAEGVDGWKKFKVMRVEEAIKTWTAETGVDLDVPSAQPAEVPASAPAARPKQDRDIEAVRRLVHHAVDRMTLSDLLRLPIAIEFILDAE